MTMPHMLAFLAFSVVAAVTPGPSNVMLTTAGANAGVVRGLPCLFGVTTGMGLMMFLVPFGIAGVLVTHPMLLRALNWCGATVLLWLAWKIATSQPPDASERREPVGFAGAAIFQWVNPKSWLVSVSAAGTFVSADASAAVQAAALGALFFIAAWPSGFVWLAFGAALQRALRDGRRVRIFNIAMGALLALSIVMILR